MKLESYENLKEKKAFEPLWLELLNASGFAGVLPNGNIVDRRYYPDATPVQKNSVFGVSEPNEVEPKIYEIDFEGHVLAKIEVYNGGLKILAAMNGYGNVITAKFR